MLPFPQLRARRARSGSPSYRRRGGLSRLGGQVLEDRALMAVIPPAPPGYVTLTGIFTQATPAVIPTTASVVTSTVNVSGMGGFLLDLNLTTFLTHTFNADLDITLTSPAGTVVTITSDNGSSMDNIFNGTVWDDGANPGGTVPYVNNTGVVTDTVFVNGVAQPTLTPEEAFGAFVGQNPNGTWTITISDDSFGDGGSLDNWSLEVTTLVAAPPGSFVSFSNTTPVAIPAGPAVVTSTIVVSGASPYLRDLNLTTFLPHSFSSDLDVTLTSPAGTVVTITTDNADFGSLDNVFNGTLWDDSANPAGQVPYTNNNGLVTDHLYVNNVLASPLVPEEALAAFIGEDPNGTWTLTISDDEVLDGGSLDSWTLDINSITLLDFGDAPDPVYPTLLASDGARHISTGPILGTLRDSETQGQASAAADGDGSDEDGVVFGIVRAGLNSYGVVTVSNAPSGALLDAWIDFNGNGTWEPGEQIADDLAVENGGNFLGFAVPGAALIGDTFARFRLSTGGVVAPFGFAADGEVEDYRVSVLPGFPTTPPGSSPAFFSYSQLAPTAIPTGPAVVTSQVTVAGAGGYLFDLNLQTFLRHSFNGDLDITLTSPAGTVVTITTDNGGEFDDVFNGTVWDDDANPGGQVPYMVNNGVVTDTVFVNGVVAPLLTPEEAFGAFIGENPNGVWTITISDDTPSDGGSLDSWSLEIATLAAAPFTLNAAVSNTTPLAIPGGPGVVTSTIAVAGFPTYLFDVNLQTFLQHSFPGDLDITLMSPAGTIVTITTDNGNGNQNIFNGTVWDDDANPGGQVPYANNNGLAADATYVNGVLRSPLVPEEALAAFIGEDPNGVWTLTISDDSALDAGTLNSWFLDFTFATLAPTPGTATVIPDPLNPGDDLLQVVGTSGNDVITIDPISGSRTQVKLNGKIIGIYPNASFDRIAAFGLEGNDKIVVNAAIAKPARLNGNDGNDTLYGGAGQDSVSGDAGNDTLYGGKANDLLLGGEGNDLIYGQDGNDTASGGNGIDRLYGEAGNDSLDGGNGSDSLYGGAGEDTAIGGTGNDTMYGDAGNDVLNGGDDSDKMYGGVGNDTLAGEDGNDTLFGEAGNDSLHGGAGEDSLSAGAGLDLARGGLGSDQISGGTENDILLGEEGDDTLLGEHGRDILIGGFGLDSLNGGDHEDILIGDATSQDANDLALRTIMAEWSANRPYATRVANVRNGTGPILLGTGFFINPALNVSDAGEVDTLKGGLSLDWFIAGVGDQASDRNATQETLN